MKKGWEYSTISDLCDKMNGLWKGKIGPFVNVGVIRKYLIPLYSVDGTDRP